jgi:hypothetical protein
MYTEFYFIVNFLLQRVTLMALTAVLSTLWKNLPQKRSTPRATVIVMNDATGLAAGI